MSDVGTTVVVGASRGLGRGIARAFGEAGAPVVAVARSGAALAELAAAGANIQIEVADAAQGSAAGFLLDQYEPRTLIVVAGASPLPRPLQRHTWETFSVNWEADVKDRVPLAAGGAAQAAAAGQPGDGDQQRGGGGGVTAQRRLRGREGHAAVHHRLRAGRGGAGWAWHRALPRCCRGSRR